MASGHTITISPANVHVVVTLGGETHENLVWSYETPIPAAEGITGLMCFYPDQVELTVNGERQPAS